MMQYIPHHYIKINYPNIYRSDTDYFFILNQGKKVGIYGIINITDRICELFICPLPGYNFMQVISRKTMKEIIKIPIELGYKELWTWSYLDIWEKILSHFPESKKEEKKPFWDQSDDKTWFRIIVEKRGS